MVSRKQKKLKKQYEIISFFLFSTKIFKIIF